MLKKFLATGAVVAGFAGLALATPAHAEGWPPPSQNEYNVSSQHDNTVVCGNRGVGDISIPVIPIGTVTYSDNEAVDCSIRVHQN